jgi:hypothetical protein
MCAGQCRRLRQAEGCPSRSKQCERPVARAPRAGQQAVTVSHAPGCAAVSPSGLGWPHEALWQCSCERLTAASWRGLEYSTARAESDARGPRELACIGMHDMKSFGLRKIGKPPSPFLAHAQNGPVVHRLVARGRDARDTTTPQPAINRGCFTSFWL